MFEMLRMDSGSELQADRPATENIHLVIFAFYALTLLVLRILHNSGILCTNLVSTNFCPVTSGILTSECVIF